MNEITVSAKTLDDAITEALIQLGATSDQVEYDIIEKGSTGFLGIGSKQAVIKAWKKVETPEVEEIKEEIKQEIVEEHLVKEQKEHTLGAVENTTVLACESFLQDVLKTMGMEVEIVSHIDEEGALNIEMKGKNMGILIGKRGQTLDSLQYLTNRVANKSQEEYVRVKLDTENYRQRRKETLENLAKNIAYKVKRTKKQISLEPMNPYERRVIHSALQGDKYVSTHSEGEEPYRRVVITLARKY
ncbi:RNA-binding cell elongation regulator Jag/EloR [Faecalimonas sp.]